MDSKDYLDSLLSVGGEYTHQLALGLIKRPPLEEESSVGHAFDAKVLEQLLEIDASKEYFEGYQKILELFPLRTVLGTDAAEFHRYQFQFALAQLIGYSGKNQAMARKYMDSCTASRACSASDLPFYTHCFAAEKCRIRQARAIAEGIPSIYIFSLPKSASAYVSNTLAQILGLADMRTSFCDFPSSVTYKPWVQSFLAGGAVSHEHVAATQDNVEELIGSGVTRLFVQVRDPMSAAFSLMNMGKLFPSKEKALAWHKQFVLCAELFSNWIAGWIEVANSARIQISFLRFAEVQHNEGKLFKSIMELAGIDPDRHLGEFKNPHPKPNFFHGDDQAYKNHFDQATLEAALHRIPLPVRDLLELT